VVRELDVRLVEATEAVALGRQAARGEVKDDRLRVRLLLDTVVQAASGLRRELALPPSDGRPADALDRGVLPAAGVPTVQGRSDDDPAVLDALLAVPLVHLLVDGYNVTKRGYPALALEQQRSRLLAGLGALAARTGAEVTVVFDGADVPVVAAAPRGVRLVFSRAGETADDVVRRYARNEPEGRPVVVVSSDKEVAEGVRRSGARALPAIALVRLLERSVGPGS
jgi:predicted RNA-binding protein with PIN domain